LIIVGAATNIGCESTARDATNRDYRVIFPSDGNIARDAPDMGWGPIPKEEVQKVVLTTLAHAFAMVTSMQELISELQRT
jgi:ureidoacrylate peracid hydrolase